MTCTPARATAPEDARSLAGPVAAARRGVVVAGRYERDAALGRGRVGVLRGAPAGRCWPTRSRARGAARRRSRTTTRCCATARSPRASSPTSCCASATCRRPSRCAGGWRACATSRRRRSTQEGRWQDPDAALCRRFALEPAAALAAAGAGPRPRADPDWLASWRSADERAAEALLGVLGAGGLSEPAVAAELGVLLPEQATLFVASSMPVRDIESFWPVRADPPRVLCNRGANGIDGTVSSAFGAAAAGPGPDGAADRRRRARARHRRPARRAAPGARSDDRADRQRRRRASSTSCRSPRPGRTSTLATSPPPPALISRTPRGCTASSTRPSATCSPSARRSSAL